MKAADKTLIFVHVPKAAGTTLLRILAAQYRGDGFHRCDLQLPGALESLLTMPDAQKAALRCVGGHLPFGLHRYLPQQASYLTMLRHPVSRFISKYHYLRRTPGLVQRLGFEPGSLDSLDAFIMEQLRRGTMNFQTRLIGGYLDWNAPRPPYDPLPPDAAWTAKDNLRQHFDVAGIVEKFHESVVLMKLAFGWRSAWYAGRNINRARPREDVPVKTRSVIERLNDQDMDLYAFAVERLAVRARELGDEFERSLRSFRRGNSVYGLVDRVVAPTRAAAKRIGRVSAGRVA
jgi:hypothetical protein